MNAIHFKIPAQFFTDLERLIINFVWNIILTREIIFPNNINGKKSIKTVLEVYEMERFITTPTSPILYNIEGSALRSSHGVPMP